VELPTALLHQSGEAGIELQVPALVVGVDDHDGLLSDIVTFVQSKTPEVLPIYEIQKKYPTSYEESMNTVLVQEVIRYNWLLEVMKENLANVKKALKGLISILFILIIISMGIKIYLGTIILRP
jgi:hypothetical protein